MNISPGNLADLFRSRIGRSDGNAGISLEMVEIDGIDRAVPVLSGEFWTSKQRDASSIHEISYRACFKPQLPGLFIDIFTSPGDRVLDPFSGRGTTVIEAALRGRRIISNDVNPLSRLLTEPRLRPPVPEDITNRLNGIELEEGLGSDIDLSMFYHPRTLSHLTSLRSYLLGRRRTDEIDDLDRWTSMVATSRLTGHSSGFFSVYTLPPNQAVSRDRQRKINKRLDQEPDFRDIRKLISKKTRSLLRNLGPSQKERLNTTSKDAVFLEGNASDLEGIDDGAVGLTVTSPPFLNIVQYSKDNWLRCWFNGLDASEIERMITETPHVDIWVREMQDVFDELYRVTREDGWVAFEVGEVKKGTLRLEEHIAPIGENSGFQCVAVLLNQQYFTKTSNIWGVSNNRGGTNTNRIALFRK